VSAQPASAPTRGPADHGSRRWSVLLWALALVAPVGALLQPLLFPSRSHMPQVDRQLNSPVILVTVAGLRPDRLHHLGYERDITPGLDRMAEQGTSFRNFYSNSNDTAETVAAMLSGRCPSQTGVQSGKGALPPRTETLPRRFEAAGYTTIALLANPELAGHDLEQGFQTVTGMAGATAGQVFDAALTAINGVDSNRYFVWIDLADLVEPFGGVALDLSTAAPDAPAGFGSTLADYDLDAAELARRGWGARELGWLSLRYDAALARLDAALARFTDALHREHRLETLTLCVVGTRGENLAEGRGRMFTHGTDLYEPSIRVACLMRLPAQQARGQQSRRLGQTADIGPTLAELGTKVEWQTPVGLSLAKAIRLQFDPNKFIAAEGRVQPVAGGPASRGTVLRPGPYKLILGADGKVREAYKVADDPGEKSPLKFGREQIDVLVGKCSTWLERCSAR